MDVAMCFVSQVNTELSRLRFALAIAKYLEILYWYISSPPLVRQSTFCLAQTMIGFCSPRMEHNRILKASSHLAAQLDQTINDRDKVSNTPSKVKIMQRCRS